MKLICIQCGASWEGEEEQLKQAFIDGWDFPPWCEVTTCPKCPSAPHILGITGEKK